MSKTIEEIKSNKIELENNIMVMINNFEKENGVMLSTIGYESATNSLGREYVLKVVTIIEI